MNVLSARLTVSIAAVVLVIGRHLMPDLLDTTDLVLLALAILPWLTSLIRSAEFPGGVKIEFQDLQRAGQKAETAAGAVPETALSSEPSFARVAQADPNLALVALRIEIERRLRSLAQRHEISPDQPLIRIFEELRRRQILSDPALSGFRELIQFGNQAAHGAQVDESARLWALEFGPRILSVLDALLGGDHAR